MSPKRRYDIAFKKEIAQIYLGGQRTAPGPGRRVGLACQHSLQMGGAILDRPCKRFSRLREYETGCGGLGESIAANPRVGSGEWDRRLNTIEKPSSTGVSLSEAAICTVEKSVDNTRKNGDICRNFLSWKDIGSKTLLSYEISRIHPCNVSA